MTHPKLRRGFLLFFLCVAACRAHALEAMQAKEREGPRLNFTVVTDSPLQERRSRPHICKGELKIAFRQPTPCEVLGTPDQLMLVMKEMPESKLVVRHSRLSPSIRFDAREGLEAYIQATRSLLGQDVPVKSHPATMPVMSWQGWTFTGTCEEDHRAYHFEVSFYNVDAAEQIVVIFRSPASDLERARALATSFLKSWFEWDPERDAGET
jgi:hypothetical protein